MTGMEIKRARGKCIANALVCQLCLTFLSARRHRVDRSRWLLLQLAYNYYYNYNYNNYTLPVLCLKMLPIKNIEIKKYFAFYLGAVSLPSHACERILISLFSSGISHHVTLAIFYSITFCVTLCLNYFSCEIIIITVIIYTGI